MARLFLKTSLVYSIVIGTILVLTAVVNFLVESRPSIQVRLACIGIGVCRLVSDYLTLGGLFESL